jgi:hypothetical protein
MRLVLGTERTKSTKEVLAVLRVYLVPGIWLPLPFVAFNWPPGAQLFGSRSGWWAYPYNVRRIWQLGRRLGSWSANTQSPPSQAPSAGPIGGGVA